jgi:hypothetical protein
VTAVSVTPAQVAAARLYSELLASDGEAVPDEVTKLAEAQFESPLEPVAPRLMGVGPKTSMLLDRAESADERPVLFVWQLKGRPTPERTTAVTHLMEKMEAFQAWHDAAVDLSISEEGVRLALRASTEDRMWTLRRELLNTLQAFYSDQSSRHPEVEALEVELTEIDVDS